MSDLGLFCESFVTGGAGFVTELQSERHMGLTQPAYCAGLSRFKALGMYGFERSE